MTAPVVVSVTRPEKRIFSETDVATLQRELNDALHRIRDLLDDRDPRATWLEKVTTNTRAQHLMDEYGITSRWV